MSIARWILAPGALCLIAGGASPAAPPKERAYTVKTPTTKVRNPFYVSNRAPLSPNPLVKLPIGSIRPEGWLRTQLKLTADGYTGHLTEISRFCRFDSNAWVSPTGQGENGWEEVPYWLKGFGDLGYVLGDKRITAEAKKWIEGVLANQAEDGYFGPRTNIAEKDKGKPTGPMVYENLDLWPNMPMLNALESYYDATGDKRVLTLMTRYFRWQLNLPNRDILPGYWDKMRGGDNVQSIYWLYNRTGEAWLLDAAKKVYASTAKWGDGVVNWHGVNITQGFRATAIFFQQSHDPKDLAATERNYQTVIEKYGQMPGGMFGADENAREGYDDPRQAAETCSMAEFMHSDQLLLGISGNPVLADRIEEIAFNSFPAAQSPDMKGLHYLTAANQPQLDRQSKAPGIENGGDMFSYNPNQYRCCQHNVAMGWPYYSEHLWMATQDRGLAAILYAASSVTAKVGPGQGTMITVKETTDYPFSDRIRFALSTSKPVAFPLLLRVPQWANGARVSVNGKAQSVRAEPLSYIVLERTWKDGDTVELTLPMAVTVKRWAKNKDAASIYRGPLAYSLKIGERWEKYGQDPWPGYEVYPTTPWNYGLVLNGKDPTASLRVAKKPGRLAAQPFTPDSAPITIQAKGRRIPNWQMRRGLVDILQTSPIHSEEPVEDITLIPMGAARLRISAFPVVGDGPEAKEWTTPPPARHTASYEFDDINAPSDGREPKNSNDQSIPRFTWWDHKGSQEWITYDLKGARPVSSVAVYWFDDRDGGGCRVPASWQLFYRDGEDWKPVANPSSYGTERDAYNRVTFDPVTTTGLKIEVQLQPQMSGGILEWKVE